MVGIALAITLLAASLVAITVIITESLKDRDRIKTSHSAESINITTELTRLKMKTDVLEDLLGDIDVSKLKDMQLDLTALKFKAGI